MPDQQTSAEGTSTHEVSPEATSVNAVQGDSSLVRGDSGAAHQLRTRYRDVRGLTAEICQPLCPEDCMVQSMTEVSPIRWHLAHTTWFFETFILRPHVAGYRTFDASFNYLFNSYYNSVGKQFPRTQRGAVSRPTVEQIWQYRSYVDQHLQEALDELPEESVEPWLPLVELGLQHEQQHQELMLTDIKHVFSCNPLYPTYRPRPTSPDSPHRAAELPVEYQAFERQLVQIGHDGHGFAFDNESPRHEALLHPYRLANRLVTNAEYLQFVEDDGYQRPTLWLSLGWDAVQTETWQAPLHWVRRDQKWFEFTLHGLQPLDLSAPVCHVSFFEADAFARWSGKRLPTEFEWEFAAEEEPVEGNFVDTRALHPLAVSTEADASRSQQMFGDVWEWTASPYVGYPGYRAAQGALGEYNGKFMCNQFVLRGGSCATSQSHFRKTYRNFFPPGARWQFSGIRLADD